MTFAEALEVLGVELPVTPEDAAKAFRKRAKETHPDVGGDPAEFRRVVEAVEIATAALRSAARDDGPIRFDPATGNLDWRDVARRQMRVSEGPLGSSVRIELSIEQTNRLTGDALGKILMEGARAFLAANGRGRPKLEVPAKRLT